MKVTYLHFLVGKLVIMQYVGLLSTSIVAAVDIEARFPDVKRFEIKFTSSSKERRIELFKILTRSDDEVNDAIFQRFSKSN